MVYLKHGKRKIDILIKNTYLILASINKRIEIWKKTQKHNAESNNPAGEPFIHFIGHFIVAYGKIRGVVRVHYIVEAVMITAIPSA